MASRKKARATPPKDPRAWYEHGRLYLEAEQARSWAGTVGSKREWTEAFAATRGLSRHLLARFVLSARFVQRVAGVTGWPERGRLLGLSQLTLQTLSRLNDLDPDQARELTMRALDSALTWRELRDHVTQCIERLEGKVKARAARPISYRRQSAMARLRRQISAELTDLQKRSRRVTTIKGPVPHSAGFEADFLVLLHPVDSDAQTGAVQGSPDDGLTISGYALWPGEFGVPGPAEFARWYLAATRLDEFMVVTDRGEHLDDLMQGLARLRLANFQAGVFEDGRLETLWPEELDPIDPLAERQTLAALLLTGSPSAKRSRGWGGK